MADPKSPNPDDSLIDWLRTFLPNDDDMFNVSAEFNDLFKNEEQIPSGNDIDWSAELRKLFAESKMESRDLVQRKLNFDDC